MPILTAPDGFAADGCGWLWSELCSVELSRRGLHVRADDSDERFEGRAAMPAEVLNALVKSYRRARERGDAAT